MIQTIPYLSQGWAGGIVFPSEVAWTWAAALLIPLILSAAAIVVLALRQLSNAKDGNARAAAENAAPAGPPTSAGSAVARYRDALLTRVARGRSTPWPEKVAEPAP